MLLARLFFHNMIRHNYIYNVWVDRLFILSPPFVCLAITATLPDAFKYSADMPVSAWVILVLLIDVGHVYSTLFRTYFDKETFAAQRNTMVGIPVICAITGLMLYSFSDTLFWRVLAYLAVYHFVRQQYGFMRIYSHGEAYGKWPKRIDSLAIYSATIYPMLYWHLNDHRNFNWFTEGDFFQANIPGASEVLFILYTLIMGIYIVKEVYSTYLNRHLNVNKNAVILGTAFSWYFGIVYYNGDLTFTLLNVVAHGIPYMTLVWAWGRKKSKKGQLQDNRLLRFVFNGPGILLFIFIISILAFIEEGLWDSLVWREHTGIFISFGTWLQQAEKSMLKIIIPILALPQIVHYVIDGYIWKIKNDQFSWSKYFFK